MNKLTHIIKKLGVYAAFLWVFPMFAFAAQATNIQDILGQINVLINALVPFFIGLAFIVFLYGVFTFVVAKGADDKDKARDIIIYGLIGLFVMVSIWGLVNAIVGTFSLENSAPTDLPKVPVIPGSPAPTP